MGSDIATHQISTHHTLDLTPARPPLRITEEYEFRDMQSFYQRYFHKNTIGTYLGKHLWEDTLSLCHESPRPHSLVCECNRFALVVYSYTPLARTFHGTRRFLPCLLRPQPSHINIEPVSISSKSKAPSYLMLCSHETAEAVQTGPQGAYSSRVRRARRRFVWYCFAPRRRRRATRRRCGGSCLGSGCAEQPIA